MCLRERAVDRPAPGTCSWPLDHTEYLSWLTRSNIGQHHGLLRLTGHPGSGKSVLVKALADACSTHTKCPENHVVTFFFDARGTSDQKSMMGLMKALLFQLSPICAKTANYIADMFKLKVGQDGREDKVEWHVEELRDALLKFCSVQRDTPIYVFVDAVDECEDIESNNRDTRSIANFLRILADTAYNADSNLNICMSCRRFPTISIRYCAEISVDVQNHGDIERYVSRELDQYELEPSTKFDIKDMLTSKAGGVFLWARLVLSSIAQRFDAGLSLDLSSALSYLEELPKTIHQLFDRILEKFSSQERSHALRLFQWAVLAQRPLSANEWIHILAFVDDPELRSIKEWNKTMYGVHGVEQLAKRLRNMSGGLLEVTSQHHQRDNHGGVFPSTRSLSVMSMSSAAAGSMEPSNLDDRVVQFIHLSACQYFLTGDGFKLLG
jgi:hypothetical protein